MDSVSNHVKPYWPTEATTASDSEDLGAPERLRVETRVNVELHAENKLNHVGDRERDPQPERERPTVGNSRDTASPNQTVANHHHHQQPEQRKGAEREKKILLLPNLHKLCSKCQFCECASMCCTYFQVQQSGFAVQNCPNSSSSSVKSYGYISNSK